MTALKAYKQQQHPINWTRIDLLLALYDGAIERLERALAALRSGDTAAALPLLVKGQAIVLELAAGVNLEVGDPTSVNLLRLYEFCVHAMTQREVGPLQSALKALTNLREGFRAIRAEAVALERAGEIPAVDAPRHVVALG